MSEPVAAPRGLLGRLGRPQPVRGAVARLLVTVGCLVVLALEFYGETVGLPGVTLGSYGVVTVAAAAWLLPLGPTLAISLAATVVPVLAIATGNLDPVTGRFQVLATVIMALATGLTVHALRRAETLRDALTLQLLRSEQLRADQAAEQLAVQQRLMGELQASLAETAARSEELAAVNQRLERFAADAAHEIKTPLAIIRAATERTLGRDRDSAQYVEALERVLAEAEHLGAVTDALLLLARAGAGEDTAWSETVDVTDLVAGVVARWDPIAESQQLRLQATLEGDGAVRGDANLLARILDNLLDNACRHTPRGGCITVTSSRDRDTWHIAVEDTGEGIPVELQPHVFERFARAGQAGPGAGLGLSLSRMIAALHRGSIALEESRAGLTRFVVSLPAC